ncbi:hypothetical protein [Agrococcus sp. Marseille-Q4369]|uniref:hypothetical protein n=1 Tax=Agrococcus sp. Marseille-Q4369 TaxID=2810513 RepID=UPI001B8ADCBF|nr:hypothetical protein [Agrococcus sp. Marseille-Q4369]QUW17718.1 hypothetical protein JSQ78_07425 [Agrococcus sp. Marseille-Q4369]
MTSTASSSRTLARGDAASLAAFVVAGAAIAVSVAVAGVVRVAELLGGGAVRVPLRFAGTRAEAPIGPGGDPVTIELDRAVVVAAELPIPSLVALVLEQAALVATVLVVVGSLLWLAVSILRGRVFSRRNTALVATAGLTAVIGAALVPLFANMGANGAVAALSGGDFETPVIAVDPFPFVMLAFVGALASTVFSVGARLQRDTEGLV